MLKNILKMLKKEKTENFNFYGELDFTLANQKANSLADLIEEKFEEISDILLEYESFEVVQDETNRTLDLLRNLHENQEYFKLRIGPVATFLPKNQPLYIFCCFAVYMSLLSTEVHLRIPHSMKNFFERLLNILEISQRFPNIHVHKKERLEFLKDRSALYINPLTNETWPVTEMVIFTGKPSHAEQLKTVFDKRTLFITNGAGHNPVVVSEDADINDAVHSVVDLQFYNQGQDCSAPNAILVHANVYQEFLIELKKEISKIKVGHYLNKECRVGPISDPHDLVRIEGILVENREWLDENAAGIINTREGILYPTIINKPLKTGGNFTETFAPIVFLQEYKKDEDLKLYFENPLYAPYAMNITLYGKSRYIYSLVDKKFNGKILHTKETILQDFHPHSVGFERGTQPYGGYGEGTSSASINGENFAMPTSPQRELFNFLVAPVLHRTRKLPDLSKYTEIHYKKVYKILRLHNNKVWQKHDFPKVQGNLYLDLQLMKKDLGELRYLKLDDEYMFSLLKTPNVEYISSLRNDEISLVHSLNELLKVKHSLSQDEFKKRLYDIPKVEGEDAAQLRNRQSKFFNLIYELLFAEKYGPKLVFFLKDVENEKISGLLDV